MKNIGDYNEFVQIMVTNIEFFLIFYLYSLY